MAVEARRGCGYRKVGGLYLVSGGQGIACCKLPIPLHVCPTCNGGIKQTRGWQWIDPRPWLKAECTAETTIGAFCPGRFPEELGEKVGLIWIGSGFYETAADFAKESAELGISRRIQKVPRGFKVGEHWVFLAHPKTIFKGWVQDPDKPDDPMAKIAQWEPAIFHVFKPTRIEIIVTTSQSQDAEFMADLEKRGLTPVIVPDDDKDHQGTAYDKEPELELATEEA